MGNDKRLETLKATIVPVMDNPLISQWVKDKVIKETVQDPSVPFLGAYWVVCTYITQREVTGLHWDIIKNISDNVSTLDLAPRGHGKSTVGDVDFCITKILRDPNIRILIGSKTDTQAKAFLKEVRSHFESNQILIRVFGDWRHGKDNLWNDREFTVNRRKIIRKEATLTALGASGAVVSKHFDMIIGDDLVGLENARTEGQRASLKEWYYSALKPTLEPHGEIHILGTRYNPLDLYEDLIRSKEYVVQIKKAINKLPDGTEVALWEDKFSLEKLQKIKAESGTIIFNMQYQNDTELAKGKIFKGKDFMYYDEYKIDDIKGVLVKVTDSEGIPKWKKVRVYAGCDLAISEKTEADYFVLMVVGLDDEHNVYVLDYVKERLSFNNQLNTILSYGQQKFSMVERIGVETVQYQQAMAQELRRLSLLPIVNINTNKDKVTRAMRRSANFENHKIFFRAGMDDLEECLLLFPEVEHDDLFDGLDFACTIADNAGKIGGLKRDDFGV